MITIKEVTEVCIVIKKSRFLGLACRADSEADAQRIIEERKVKHHDARHNCFAWMLENGVMRYSDDGEPQGTAGIPILETIKNSGLINVLVIVTRYFGGTLLGAPGLVRAYTQCAAQALGLAPKVRLKEYKVYDCIFDFAAFSRIQSPLIAAGCIFDTIAYGSDIRAIVCIAPDKNDFVLKQISNLTSGRTVPVLVGSKRILSDI